MIPPSVFVFEDRIEIQSYGRIPYMVTVTIPFAFLPDWAISHRQNGSQFSDEATSTVRVLEYLANNRNASIAKAEEATGLSTSSVSKIIAVLKKDGLLRNDGNNRRNEWVRTG